MLNAKSHFKVLPLTLAVVASCHSPNESMRFVDRSQYAGDLSCWFSSDRRVDGFLVMARKGNIGVPYLISSKCMVGRKYPESAVSTLELINAIKLEDNGGLLQSRFRGIEVVDNVGSDLPAPSDQDEIYVVGIELVPIDRSVKTYELRDIVRLRATGVSFIDFLKMSPSRRFQLGN